MNRETNQLGLPKHTGWVVLAIVLVVPFGAIGFWYLTYEPDDSLLTREKFEAAREKWQTANISSYNLELVVGTGKTPNNIQIKVRDGEVVSCEENGVTPPQQYLWDDWTIPEQFKMIEEDLIRESQGGFRTKENVQIKLFANFHPELGYPLLYRRKVVRGASPLNHAFRIEKFEPVKTER